MGDNRKCLTQVAMILNIIIGCFGVLYGANLFMWWLNHGTNADLQYFIQWLFFALCVILLGLVLIFVEVKFKHQKILQELGLLSHYFGRGCFAMFLGALCWGRGAFLWNDNMKWGGTLGLVSGILQWVMYFFLGVENCP